MGNKSLEQFKRKQRLGYKVQLIDVDMKVDIESVKFKQSSYNILEQRFMPKPMMDKAVRDSQYCMLDCPQLSEASKLPIKNFLAKQQRECKYVQVNTIWRMTKYNEGGHFLQHCDRQKQHDNYVHFGTEIFIPPKNIIPYQGGQLILTHDQKSSKFLHVLTWIPHQVNKVTEGFRISYVKQIWVKDESKIQTDQDRIKREHTQAINQQRQRTYEMVSKKQMKDWEERRWKNRKNLPRGHLD